MTAFASAEPVVGRSPIIFRTVGDALPLLEGLARPHIARALSFMDRDPSSPTYGSMDRAYWYYRTLTNFPGAVWQQPMVGFAALLGTAPDMPDPSLRETAIAALTAWTRCQHAGGAFDEWYRNEHSYCPTAITTAGAVVSLSLLGDRIDQAIRTRVLACAERAADWLTRRYNPEVMNQNLAAAVAFAGLGQLGKASIWRERAENLLARIAANQSAEGWFSEYGGFDFGYSTLALDFLALAGEFGLASITDTMAERLIRFLLDVIVPGKPIPGRLASRGTSHGFPFGAIDLAPRVPGAARLTTRLLHLHAAGLAPSPETIDDRYFAYFYFPAFSLAYHAALKLHSVALPDDSTAARPTMDYPHSGLAIRQMANTTLLCSRRLGGALALLTDDHAPLYHLGYTVTVDGRRYSSAVWQDETSAQDQPGTIQTVSRFLQVSGGQPLRRWSIAFQIVIHLLVTSRIAEAFQHIVKKLMITPKRGIALKLERRISVSDCGVTVLDTLRPGGALPVDSIVETSEITMHSPSARQEPASVLPLDGAHAGHVLSDLRAGNPTSIEIDVMDTLSRCYKPAINSKLRIPT